MICLLFACYYLNVIGFPLLKQPAKRVYDGFICLHEKQWCPYCTLLWLGFKDLCDSPKLNHVINLFSRENKNISSLTMFIIQCTAKRKTANKDWNCQRFTSTISL